METPIVVLIDADQRVVHLFGKYNRTIPFQDAYLLPIFIRGHEVLYISQVDEVSGEDVCASVNELAGEELPSGRYIHGKVDGYLRAPDVRLTLGGLRDSKPLDKLGYDVFERSPSLQKLLLEDKIEIISEEMAIAIKKKLPGLKARDRALDEIIVKTSVQDVMDRDDFFDDPDVDEITSEQGEVLTEAEQIIRQGIGKRIE